MTAGFEPDTPANPDPPDREDLDLRLNELLANPPPYPEIGVEPPRRDWWRWLALLGAGVFVGAMVAGVVAGTHPEPRTPITVPGLQVTRTEFITPPTVTTTVSVTVLGLIPSSLLGGNR